MLSLVRSSFLRLIACVVVFLPLCMLVAHVYTPYSHSESGSVLTFGLSFVESVQSPAKPVQSRELPPVNRIAISATSVLGGPSLSVSFINQILASADSPAAGTGQALYDLSVQYGVYLLSLTLGLKRLYKVIYAPKV